MAIKVKALTIRKKSSLSNSLFNLYLQLAVHPNIGRNRFGTHHGVYGTIWEQVTRRPLE